MDRRERGPGISTRSDSLPSGTRQVQSFVVAPQGLSEAFFHFNIRFRHGFRPKRFLYALASVGGAGKRKPS
jgi:hypothetical protein